MSDKIEYKTKYYRTLIFLWVILTIGLIFFYIINKKLTVLETEITDFKIQKNIQLYIDSGWMPPYKRIKRKNKNDKN